MRAKEGDVPLPLYWEDQVVAIIARCPPGEMFDFMDVWDHVVEAGLDEGHDARELGIVFPRAVRAGLIHSTALVRDRPEMTTRLWQRTGGTGEAGGTSLE